MKSVSEYVISEGVGMSEQAMTGLESILTGERIERFSRGRGRVGAVMAQRIAQPHHKIAFRSGPKKGCSQSRRREWSRTQ